MSEVSAKLQAGRPYPLGATCTPQGVNFAIFSNHATKVELCLFDENTHEQTKSYILKDHTDGVWHGLLPEGNEGLIYGYRIDGPYEPQRGHRFNPYKLLLDPYAKKTVGEFCWHDDVHGYDINHEQLDLIRSESDSAHAVPKCVVVKDLSPQEIAQRDQSRPHHAWADTVIYEVHVKGFTQLHPHIPESIRGTYKGLASPEALRYLKELGVTVIELLPVHGFIDETFLTQQNLSNYWGYNSLHFFQPHQAYQHEDAISEFRALTHAAHEHGLEVILDVVYNHTCEGNQLGPTLSFRGVDNASYYSLQQRDARYYVNDTGCGNTLNAKHPRVIQLILDSLRYWVEQMGVDGFRFDLATVLGRESYGFDAGAGFFDAIRQDPVLAKVKMIAEPWDIGPGGYQLGGYPAGWSEWNDKYRDIIRQFWRGDAGVLPEFARRIHGSSDIFEHSGRRPSSSINFITSHDGFSLKDTVSFNDRHNEANNENNSDGHHSNFSFNHGVEGDTDNHDVIALRYRQMRNFLATLVLSQGTPMILGGDEFGRTQHGNNNAYCQDNEINWFNWQGITQEDKSLQAFVTHVLSLRRQFSLLTSSRYIHHIDEPDGQVAWCVRWCNICGEQMKDAQWAEQHAHSVGWILEKIPVENDTDKQPRRLIILFNASGNDIEFTLPHDNQITSWACLLDTYLTSGQPEQAERSVGEPVMLAKKSMQLLCANFIES